jgi:hypothetical protein
MMLDNLSNILNMQDQGSQLRNLLIAAQGGPENLLGLDQSLSPLLNLVQSGNRGNLNHLLSSLQ